MQKKGIVMQIKDGQAILMTQDGQFLKVPLQEGMMIGQEAEVTEVVQPAVRAAGRSWFRSRWQQTGIVAASLLFAVGIWGSQSQLFTPTVYAYVTVDINPSVELSIDEDLEVITATALNADGERVLAGLKLNGKMVEDAVEAFTETAHEQGFLHDNSEVVITASPAVEPEQLTEEGVNLDGIEEQLVEAVHDSAGRHDLHVSVEGLQVSQALRKASHDAGLSPGKYALYLMAQANGIDVSVEELKTQPISKIVEKRGTDLADVLHDLKGKEHLDDLLDTLKKEGETGLKPQGNSQTPPGQDKKEPNQDSKDDQSGKPTDKPDKKDEKQGKQDPQIELPIEVPQSDKAKPGNGTEKEKNDDKKGKGRD